MIVPMKKMTLILREADQERGLRELRKLGIVHVEPMRPPQSESVDALETAVRDAERALVFLEDTEFSKPKKENGKRAVTEILDLARKRDALEAQLQEKLSLRRWFDTWGSVSLSDVQLLRDAGIFLSAYRTDRASLKKESEDHAVVILAEEKGEVYAVFAAETPEEKLDLPEDVMPPLEVATLDEEIAALKRQRKAFDKAWKDAARTRPAVEDHLESLRKDLEFQLVRAGMDAAESLVFLRGYCPEEEVDPVKRAADKEGWGTVFEEPDDPMHVPTLLKNRKPVRIIQPLFDFMGTLPGYNEVDVSFVFLLFFSVFYAMIIGDAGYGLLFLGGTVFARLKARKAPFEPFALFFVLSITTIVWGALTGTWFGSRAIAEWAPLRELVIENMFSFNDSAEATRFMMRFSFTLGMIHLVLGRLISFVKQLPSIKAIAQLGWALIVVGIFFVADFLVLSNPMPGFVLPLILSGLVLVGVFTNFVKHPLKLVGAFFGTVAFSSLDVISSFSDVVSYIRLFAVGVASVTVAASFNEMAGGILAPLVLVFGHGLNIILGMMSVMVHGVRLNMLEFSGHLGQEWTGKEYKPFKE